MTNMRLKACELVCDYVLEHIDKTDKVPSLEVYVVWQCKVLQNWKFLISTDIPVGMYYVLTFFGDKIEWYLDAYYFFANRCISIF